MHNHAPLGLHSWPYREHWNSDSGRSCVMFWEYASSKNKAVTTPAGRKPPLKNHQREESQEDLMVASERKEPREALVLRAMCFLSVCLSVFFKFAFVFQNIISLSGSGFLGTNSANKAVLTEINLPLPLEC